jgi:hypothetical protein
VKPLCPADALLSARFEAGVNSARNKLESPRSSLTRYARIGTRQPQQNAYRPQRFSSGIPLNKSAEKSAELILIE